MAARFFLCLGTLLALSAGFMAASAARAADAGKLTLYTTRESKADFEQIKKFSEETGIRVDIVSGKFPELVQRLEAEKNAPKADLFMTADGGLLDLVKQKGLLQPVTDKTILDQTPSALRDADGHWIGLTTRARVIVYAKDRVNPDQLSTYEDLADPKWKGKLVMRPGSALYNVSLLASLIELDGEDAAARWVRGVSANFARAPEGNDRRQARDIAAGKGDVTLMNTYYLGRMLNSADKAEREAARKVGVFFPNQDAAGTHINICGIGVVNKTPNRQAAEQLIAYLTDAPAQSALSAGNYEYPVNPKAEKAAFLEALGPFKAQAIDFSVLNANREKAKALLSRWGWT